MKVTDHTLNTRVVPQAQVKAADIVRMYDHFSRANEPAYELFLVCVKPAFGGRSERLYLTSLANGMTRNLPVTAGAMEIVRDAELVIGKPVLVSSTAAADLEAARQKKKAQDLAEAYGDMAFAQRLAESLIRRPAMTGKGELFVEGVKVGDLFDFTLDTGRSAEKNARHASMYKMGPFPFGGPSFNMFSSLRGEVEAAIKAAEAVKAPTKYECVLSEEAAGEIVKLLEAYAGKADSQLLWQTLTKYANLLKRNGKG